MTGAAAVNGTSTRSKSLGPSRARGTAPTLNDDDDDHRDIPITSRRSPGANPQLEVNL